MDNETESISITSEIIDHVISERTEIYREGISMVGEGGRNGYLIGKLDALNKVEDMIKKLKKER